MSNPMPGVEVEVYALDWTELGPVHAPPPVSVGDVLALVCGPPLKVMSVFQNGERATGVSVRPVYLTARDAPEIG